MDRKQEIKKLIAEHQRHLTILRQQETGYGSLDVPTRIVTQIQDREAQIERLQAELVELLQTPKPPAQDKTTTTPATFTRKFLNLLRDPIWQMIGVLVAIIGVVLAIYSPLGGEDVFDTSATVASTQNDPNGNIFFKYGGTIIDSDTSKPIRAAFVTITCRNNENQFGSSPQKVTNTSGIFELGISCPSNIGFLKASAKDYHNFSEDVVLTPDSQWDRGGTEKLEQIPLVSVESNQDEESDSFVAFATTQNGSELATLQENQIQWNWSHSDFTVSKVTLIAERYKRTFSAESWSDWLPTGESVAVQLPGQSQGSATIANIEQRLCPDHFDPIQEDYGVKYIVQAEIDGIPANPEFSNETDVRCTPGRPITEIGGSNFNPSETTSNVSVAATQTAAAIVASNPTTTPAPMPIPTETEEPTPTDTPTPTPEPTVTTTNTPLPPTLTNTMVLIPAGPFKMGSDGGDGDEQPVRTVTLDAFYIDQYEVTNAQYAACVTAGKCTLPACVEYYENPDKTNHPIVCIDWEQANAYCRWRGDRLPTEAEWEKAARGTEGLIYPWGDELPNETLLNIGGNVDDTTPVGSYPDGVSPYGVYDMGGNVWEWVNDWYDDNYYATAPNRNPQGPNTGNTKVLRGGSWNPGENNARASNRSGYAPYNRGSIYGFRCALSAPE